MEKQDELNRNVQERLRAAEAHQQVLVAFLVALIETHPEREKLRERFAFHYETLHAGWLAKPLAEDWLDSARRLRAVLDQSFDRPRP